MNGFNCYLVLLLCPLFILSCSKDEEDTLNDEKPEILGEFKVDGSSYELHDGSISYWGSEGDTIFYYGIFLHSSGINYEMNHGYTGEGSSVAFFIASSMQGAFATESFPVNNTGHVQKEEAFDVELYPFWEPDGDNKNSMDYFGCTSGTITIIISGDSLMIDIEGIANKMDPVTDEIIDTDISVSAYYTGEF